jgi:hypothetical protein
VLDREHFCDALVLDSGPLIRGGDVVQARAVKKQKHVSSSTFD